VHTIKGSTPRNLSRILASRVGYNSGYKLQLLTRKSLNRDIYTNAAEQFKDRPVDMRELIFLALLCWGKVFSLSIPTDGHPYCSKDTCPKYNIVKKLGGLELRCYRPSIWVSVSGQGKLFVDDHNLPIWKLAQFINGNNTKKVQVPIGVITSKLFDERKRVFTTEYYVPDYFWDSMPREIDHSVRVLYRREFCAYVYGFPGWLHSYQTLTRYRTRAKMLIQQYGNFEDYYPDFFLYMTYKSGILPRYNEIWYVIKFGNKKGHENSSS